MGDFEFEIDVSNLFWLIVGVPDCVEMQAEVLN